ncbi:glycosyltransferase family 39 protein [Oligoflexia bacterium]|nr:glycosyltransferase family 39 protein [Oligoflexia bacterium]
MIFKIVRPFFFLVHILFLLGIFFFAADWAVLDETQSRRALDALTPTTNILINVGQWFLQFPLKAATISTAIILLLLTIYVIAKLVASKTQYLNAASIMVCSMLALAGQILLLNMAVLLGCIAYALAALILIFARFRLGEFLLNCADADDVKNRFFSVREACLLFLIAVIAIYFRLYALNHIFNVFEGELSAYYAGATYFPGMLYANIAFHGPWAPLGLLFYPPIYFTTSLFGSSILAVRLASALIGVFTICLLYFFVRHIANRRVALFAAALMALDPIQIMWSRTDIHPHGVTTWPTIIICWLTYQALKTERLCYFVLTALLMGVAWHQYPSGQLAFAIPILAVLYHFIVTPGFFRRCWAKATALIVGILAWLSGNLLTVFLATGQLQMEGYLTQLGPRFLWVKHADLSFTERVLYILQIALTHLGTIIQGLFYRVTFFHHQTVVPEVHSLEPRSVVWFVAAFGVVGILMLLLHPNSKKSVVLLAWGAVALLPAVFSDQALIKRAATFYPCFIICAALGLSLFMTKLKAFSARWLHPLGCVVIVIGYCVWLSVTANLWFSGNKFKYSAPREQELLEVVVDKLKPATMLIGDFEEIYMLGIFTFLLQDHFSQASNRPLAWYYVNPSLTTLDEVAEDPIKAFRALDPEIWYYSWTAQHEDLYKLKPRDSWDRLIYIFQYPEQVDEHVAIVKRYCPSAQVTTFPGRFRYNIRIVICDEKQLAP